MNQNNKTSDEPMPYSQSTSSQPRSGATNNGRKKSKKMSSTRARPKRFVPEVLNYQKLVKTKRMHSPYWKHFGFPASETGKIITQSVVVCKLCRNQLVYKCSTTNLREHLQSRHKSEFLVLEFGKFNIECQKEKHGENQLLPSTTSGGQVDVNMSSNYSEEQQHVYNQGENRENVLGENTMNDQSPPVSVVIREIEDLQNDVIRKNISEAIIEFVIADLQRPDFVESKSFQRFIGTLMSACDISGKCNLEQKALWSIYEDTRRSVLRSISQSCSYFTLGIEQWTCISSNVYITFSVFFQEKSNLDGMCVKQLATILCDPDKSAGDWRTTLGAFFSKWHISVDRVKVVIKAFSNHGLEEALKRQGFIVIPCLVYGLQELCTKSCFETEDVLKVLAKCRTVSAKLQEYNATFQDNVQVENCCFGREYPRIWTTTYHYLEQFVQQKNSIMNNCRIINNLFFQHEILTDEDWSVIEDVVSILEPLKNAVVTLIEEKIPLISILQPIIISLTRYDLKIKTGDSHLAAFLKNVFVHGIRLMYAEFNVQTFLHISTVLDPRFKGFSTDEVDEKLSIVKQELMKLVEIEESVTHDLTPCKSSEVVSTVPKTARAIQFLFGNVATCSPIVDERKKSLENLLNTEVDQYKLEDAIPFKDCPLLRWTQISSKYQNISRLAKKYLVYALSSSSSKLPLESKILYHGKRSQLNHELLDKMLFMNANRAHQENE